MKTFRIILPMLVFCIWLSSSYAQDTRQAKTETATDAKAATGASGKQSRSERRATRRAARTSVKVRPPNNAKDRMRSPYRSHNAENNLGRRRHM